MKSPTPESSPFLATRSPVGIAALKIFVPQFQVAPQSPFIVRRSWPENKMSDAKLWSDSTGREISGLYASFQNDAITIRIRPRSQTFGGGEAPSSIRQGNVQAIVSIKPPNFYKPNSFLDPCPETLSHVSTHKAAWLLEEIVDLCASIGFSFDLGSTLITHLSLCSIIELPRAWNEYKMLLAQMETPLLPRWPVSLWTARQQHETVRPEWFPEIHSSYSPQTEGCRVQVRWSLRQSRQIEHRFQTNRLDGLLEQAEQLEDAFYYALRAHLVSRFLLSKDPMPDNAASRIDTAPIEFLLPFEHDFALRLAANTELAQRWREFLGALSFIETPREFQPAFTPRAAKLPQTDKETLTLPLEEAEVRANEKFKQNARAA